jgi:hypothetical protein
MSVKTDSQFKSLPCLFLSPDRKQLYITHNCFIHSKESQNIDPKIYGVTEEKHCDYLDKVDRFLSQYYSKAKGGEEPRSAKLKNHPFGADPFHYGNIMSIEYFFEIIET